jgi:hypothetical protein
MEQCLTTNTHPVWTLYDRLRTARLNVKYYGRLLLRLQRWNMGIEISLAVATSTSIGGLWIWEAGVGAIVWKLIAVPTAVMAVCKPLLALTKRIKEIESLVTGYRLLDFELMEIGTKVEQKKEFDSALRNQLNKVIQQEKTLISRAPEPRPSKKILKQCREEVEQELPVDSFYVPEKE